MDQDQLSISRTLGVTTDFDAALEVRRRIDFLGRYLRQASCRTFVLGISGGVDSLVAGLLAQTAVSEVRADGYDAQFIAVRLPYGVQADETDAQKSLDVIGPDRVVTVDIQPAADAMLTRSWPRERIWWSRLANISISATSKRASEWSRSTRWLGQPEDW